MLTDHKADNTSNLFIGKYVIFCCSSKEFPNRIPIHSNDSFFVTTHVVRLKLFRLKAEGLRKERLPHFGGETTDFRIKHGFKVRTILAFPNSLQPLAYPPE